MKKRLPLKHDDEFDVVNHGWRRFYVYTQRAGLCKKVKTRINRRERRDGRAEAAGPW